MREKDDFMRRIAELERKLKIKEVYCLLLYSWMCTLASLLSWMCTHRHTDTYTQIGADFTVNGPNSDGTPLEGIVDV
eukprot:1339233-Amorphochlora_amoeboformis.AAC.1